MKTTVITVSILAFLLISIVIFSISQKNSKEGTQLTLQPQEPPAPTGLAAARTQPQSKSCHGQGNCIDDGGECSASWQCTSGTCTSGICA